MRGHCCLSMGYSCIVSLGAGAKMKMPIHDFAPKMREEKPNLYTYMYLHRSISSQFEK